MIEYDEISGLPLDSTHHNYVVIPIEIWTAKDLSWNERNLLVEIDRHTRHGRDCFMSNKYIAEFLGVAETNASKILNSLIDKGYVKKTKFDGRKRYIASTIRTVVGCQSRLDDVCQGRLDDSVNPDLTQTSTIIVNEYNSNKYNSKRENNNNARTREDLIAEITENTQWVENQMKAGLTKDDVTELVNYAYDYLFNTTANEPSKGDVVRCAHYKIQEFKEYKRRAAVKAAPKEERRMAFWKESQRYYAQYSKQMRNDFVAYYIKDLKEDPDLMVFEQWPNFDMPAQLKQWKLKNEQRQSSTI